MTIKEKKAIKWMKNVKDNAVVTLDHIKKNEPNVSPMLYAGRKEKAETIIKGFEELEQYRAIGTIEKCREMKERQIGKKLKKSGMSTICTECDHHILRCYDYCPGCGQAIEWSE